MAEAQGTLSGAPSTMAGKFQVIKKNNAEINNFSLVFKERITFLDT
jgi:hypothetical protein